MGVTMVEPVESLAEDELWLDCGGVRVSCAGDPEAIRGLSAHFAAFLGPRSSRPDVRVQLRRAEPPPVASERRRCDQVVDRGIVYNFGATTVVDHHGHARSEYDFAAERGVIDSLHLEDLVELAYLMIHSRVGLLLEARGLVRLHCVGIELDGKAALVLASSGGGKSTLARALLRETSVRLLGDDMVLIDKRGWARPFHSPLGVTDPAQAEGLGQPIPFVRRQHADKWIIPLDALRDRLAPGPVPVSLVLCAERVTRGPSAVVPAPRMDVLAVLARDMVIGLGLPQVIELVARRGARDVVKQLPSLRRRLHAASRLLLARTAVLELADASSAAQAIVAALDDSPPRG